MALDWTHLADRGGGSIESLVAQLLTAKYGSEVRRVNPSQGDGGIDVYLNTQEGLVVWQVKKFTSPLTDGQWRQVARSWKRFVTEHVEPGEEISTYHLVTPWLPTEEARRRLDAMTSGVTFPRDWWGDDHLQLLDAEFPFVAERWQYGSAAFDRQVGALALLASRSPGGVEEPGYADAIRDRREVLDHLQNLEHEHYTVDSAYRTVRQPGDWPRPAPGDAGVFMRMTQVNPTRFYVETVVPKGPDSVELEPISLHLDFSKVVNEDEKQRVRDWLQWGAPLENVPSVVQMTGGPHADPEPKEVTLGRAEVIPLGALPNLHWQLTLAHDEQVRVLPLSLVEQTFGALTGWLRFVFEMQSGLLRFEIRYAPQAESENNSTVWELGDTDGRPLQLLRDEAEALLEVGPDGVATFGTDTGIVLLTAKGAIGGDPVFESVRRLCDALLTLERNALEPFLTPRMTEVADEQFDTVVRLQSLYSGETLAYRWTQHTVILEPGQPAPDLGEGGAPLQVRQPFSILVGERVYELAHPLLHELESAVVRSLEHNEDGTQALTVVPGANDEATLQAEPGWTGVDPASASA